MIKFIIKGILRDRSRSLFPLLVVAIGVILTVLFYCWISGAFVSFVDTSAKFDSGHVKVMSRAYAENADQIPNELAYIGVQRLTDELKRDFPGYVWTPRIRFGGLLDVPDDQGETQAQGPVIGLAVDLFSSESPERDLLNLENSVIRGRSPNKPGEILVSDEFATRLGLAPSETVTLIGSTMYGSMAAANFRVAGTVRFGISALDRGAMVADVTDIQVALNMEDASGEILGFFDDFVYREKDAEETSEIFNSKYEGEDNEFLPVMKALHNQGGVADIPIMAKAYLGVIVGIFMIVMSIVLWNAGLIGSLRRYGEIGVRLAMGENKGHLYRSLLAESIILGCLGSIIGTAIGLVFSYWLQAEGIDWSAFTQKSTLLVDDIIRASVTPASYVIGFIPGLGATLIGTSIAGIGIYKRKTAQLMKELEA